MNFPTAVARFTGLGSTSTGPGAHALGFILSPAPQTGNLVRKRELAVCYTEVAQRVRRCGHLNPARLVSCAARVPRSKSIFMNTPQLDHSPAMEEGDLSASANDTDLFLVRTEEARSLAAVQREEALNQARILVRENDRDPNAYISAARTCKQTGELYEALEILKSGLQRCPPTPALHEYYIERLEKCNLTDAAIDAARHATLLFPDELIFRLRDALLLPVFYDSSAQVAYYRNRFTEGLHRIVSEVKLATPVERQRALDAIARSSNKYLPYQRHDDRELQSLYGEWVQRIMRASFPEFASAVAMSSVTGKIRVGFLTSQSGRFLGTSAAKLFGGWIRELDRNDFDVFAYHADRLPDSTTNEVRRWNTNFRQLSGSPAESARLVRGDQLHALVFLDFGIHPRMAQLAALRLAPVQCVAWDTPLTSGIPAMDCFLSSELMEPDGASGHYSEELVTLPGVGVCFQKPVIPRMILTKQRRDFGLRDDAVVYLCCQSIFKYSPEQDLLVAQIAKQVPGAQFVFLVTNEVVSSDFQLRIERAFRAEGLSAADHCVWLREMDLLDFWNLNLVADVSLDTVGCRAE